MLLGSMDAHRNLGVARLGSFHLSSQVRPHVVGTQTENQGKGKEAEVPHEIFGLPWWVAVLADILVFLGYLLFVYVIRENRYASRVVEVETEQKIVNTGPYAFVRHPMYVANILIYSSAPLALGSYWAMPIAAAGILFILVRRIRNEEEVLMRDLQGYREYMTKTRYRLIPGIW
jgi:protein-S-isoprenylcysteine O-methyltransferase Ste14